MSTNTGPEIPTIVITRSVTHLLPGRYVHCAQKWDYRCTGPDGVEYQNDSIGTLRSLLKRRYGDKRKCTIVESWKS